MPKISVVIPAYNAELTIAETINSVLLQTFTNFELIVINDGSKDKTLEIVEGIDDKRVKVFSYENGGLPTARNRGITRAVGEFIAFLDADDLWTPDKLELQLAALQQHPEAGVAYSWTCVMNVDAQGKPVSYHPCLEYSFTGNVYQQLLMGDFIHSGSNTLIRRQAIASVGGFDPTLKSCEDWDYWLRLAACWQFVVVPKYQIFYRRTPGAMSSKVEVMKEAALLALEKAYQTAPPELQFLKPLTLINFHKYCADLYLQYRTDSHSIWQALQHLWSIICLSPKNLIEKTTQKLLIKSFVLLVFPSQVVIYLRQFKRKLLLNRNSSFMS
ncbi:glycosyltransferase [Scytonema sp. UIC 10036]|uniref:glycosyltransferase family 2 protein n=1 Tax=Scytonema sp. UIC 10036 TaxID=2304196 RepID=UPI0012DA5C26|nr:glycosyltransferase family A protein [Scytonema sp. UIC 10036]MUG99151.1 glycosyltransferase [Scytonema sp. UIC 10036]